MLKLGCGFAAAGGNDPMTKVEQALKEKGRPLLGVSVTRHDPAFVELAAEIGFEILWIEMEHMPVAPAEAANLCRIAEALGMLALLRLPDARRDSVLKVAESGPSILLLPMANTPEVLRELVTHALYPPVGQRGFFGISRAIGYGLKADIAAQQQRVNQDLCLMGQIETQQAVDSVDELCAVEGIGGFIIGPGDLSASMGITGQLHNPSVSAAIEQTLQSIKAHGKLAGIAWGGPGLGRWAQHGADILVCGGDISCLRTGLQGVMEKARGELNG